MARQANPEGSGRKRTVEVRVKLSPVIAESFAAIAEVRGLLPATLAAVVIGEFIEKQALNAQLQQLSVVEMTKHLSQNFDEDKLAAAFNQLNPDLFRQLAEVSQAGQDGSSAAPEAAAPSEGCCGAAPPAGDRARSAT